MDVGILNLILSVSHQLDHMGKEPLHGTMDLLYRGPHAQIRAEQEEEVLRDERWTGKYHSEQSDDSE